VPNAVDTAVFRSGGVPEPELRTRLGLDGALVLGFIGSFYAYEGLPVLLRALPAMLAREPRLRLLLVGGGEQEPELKRLAAELGIAGEVHFTGRVPHAEVQRYYDLVEALVYPRLSTRLTELVTPLKPLEAMAQGKLVIASDVGGHRELIRHGETGVLFKAGDPATLAAAVLDLLGHPERWTGIKAAARHYVETERTWQQTGAAYDGLYTRLLKAQPAA
jgi:glycosyltransferase involved in cell wall biosynthesis